VTGTTKLQVGDLILEPGASLGSLIAIAIRGGWSYDADATALS
jgi:hypothetical protein